MSTPRPQQVYVIELCSGERRRWRFQGSDAQGNLWWQDVESSKEFSESSLMYAWRICGPDTSDAEAASNAVTAASSQTDGNSRQ